jgi:hypothetical protein
MMAVHWLYFNSVYHEIELDVYHFADSICITDLW